MKIDVFVSELCGSYHDLHENLNKALVSAGVSAEVEYHTLYYEDAISRNILGSPSIWINGQDAFESGSTTPGIT
ncbi:MAG TPA: thioredoxin family protein [Nitrospirota bacterium]|nr:thioredoxin family protein [Nitrospirota bacterium]